MMDTQLSILVVSFLITLGFAMHSMYQCWINREKSKSKTKPKSTAKKVVTTRSGRGIRARVAISNSPSYPPELIYYASLPFLFLVIAASIYPSIRSQNYVDMGFGIVHPVNECVRGETASTLGMSMEFICTDATTVEMRMYEKNDQCDGQYYSANTFDCSSTSSFVKCDCSLWTEDSESKTCTEKKNQYRIPYGILL